MLSFLKRVYNKLYFYSTVLRAPGRFLRQRREKRCNICGGSRFAPGSLNRMTPDGQWPLCRGCLSSERHRMLRRLYDAMLPMVLARKKVLCFSWDCSLNGIELQSLETSIYGGENSMDLQAIDRPDNSYDMIVCNHVLEHVEKDEQAMAELLRITTEDGFVQITVPEPTELAVTDEWGWPDESQHGHYRLYGRDISDKFDRVAGPDNWIMVESTDPVTERSGFIYFLAHSQKVLADIRQAAQRME